ncbi:Nop12p [Saccharomyces cerevisiae YJM1190]|nr:Nop12p [Saccharomyces cerevisiae YJM320]AJT77284.1 Nop12p [Saccharomyces cerevisiae YJM456]AJT78255.1 Nop12p [Saccharomyces cerevisiae YJM541]AJT81703.1 Nop12p [Saccharomyces cerevisiae YJM689]AJT82186.1 Nop12p [Saccharomyces cerevisiae YJM693]AJT88567.1 Nop12p [Saccharomyces cerevisiae YJM1190]AJT93379.1 Nop12p [Saccharomyces cerevisiae YJM1304]AJT97790.1 Nop12p [Saccharomyces cerevisiae YJM1355]CAI4761409.1 ABH_G0048710.mRNA.1.CDS.1 [Saccharomyces cerevisiae]
MSSAIDNLFGNIDEKKIESSVDKLFSSSCGPINKLEVKSKTRTVLPDSKKRERAAEADQEEKEASKPDVSDEQTEEVALPKVKKAKKSKRNDEHEDLEARYYAKLLNEEAEAEDDKPTVTKTDETSVPLTSAAKKVDFKEDELEKAERTVFIGNILSTVITSKKVYKEFKKLFGTNPIAETEESGNEKEEESSKKSDNNEFAIESIRFRSISFDEALPRKVAFVQQKFHKSRDTINAYIVYKNKSAVRKICSNLNAVVFQDHHLRVDSVAHPAPHDKKRSIFVGNLDFEEIEESLWKHFEPCGDIEYVRIIRDSKTNMGKGFAYVQFKDLQSVNKALLLNEKPMKSQKQEDENTKKPTKKARKLRVSRCKNMKKGTTIGTGLDRNGLTDSQRTRAGRAKKILGKADRATLGQEITIEGLRAKKGEGSTHLKKKKQRSATGRVTKRSIAFKKAQAEKSKK